MDSNVLDKFASELFDNIEPSTVFNKDDETLPFAYYEPTSEGKITWVCGFDQDNKITSIFSFQGPDGVDKKGSYLKDMDEAKFHRDELRKSGWRKLDPPKIDFSYGGKTKEKLNRKERRYLQKKMEALQRTQA